MSSYSFFLIFKWTRILRIHASKLFFWNPLRVPWIGFGAFVIQPRISCKSRNSLDIALHSSPFPHKHVLRTPDFLLLSMNMLMAAQECSEQRCEDEYYADEWMVVGNIKQHCVFFTIPTHYYERGVNLEYTRWYVLIMYWLCMTIFWMEESSCVCRV